MNRTQYPIVIEGQTIEPNGALTLVAPGSYWIEKLGFDRIDAQSFSFASYDEESGTAQVPGNILYAYWNNELLSIDNGVAESGTYTFYFAGGQVDIDSNSSSGGIKGTLKLIYAISES